MTGSTWKCVNKSSGAELTGCGILVKRSPSSSVSVCAPGKLLFQSNFASSTPPPLPRPQGPFDSCDPTSQLAYLSIEACSCIRGPDSCCAANRSIWMDRFGLCFSSYTAPSCFLFLQDLVQRLSLLCWWWKTIFVSTKRVVLFDPLCVAQCLGGSLGREELIRCWRGSFHHGVNYKAPSIFAKFMRHEAQSSFPASLGLRKTSFKVCPFFFCLRRFSPMLIFFFPPTYRWEQSIYSLESRLGVLLFLECSGGVVHGYLLKSNVI